MSKIYSSRVVAAAKAMVAFVRKEIGEDKSLSWEESGENERNNTLRMTEIGIKAADEVSLKHSLGDDGMDCGIEILKDFLVVLVIMKNNLQRGNSKEYALKLGLASSHIEEVIDHLIEETEKYQTP